MKGLWKIPVPIGRRLCIEGVLIDFPPVENRPVAVLFRHMAADAAEEKARPREGYHQGRAEVNQPGQADVDHSHDAPHLVRPIQAVAKLKGQQAKAGENGEAVPDVELEKGDMKNESAKESSCYTDVGGPQ
jgi:hypothetical protein